MSAKGTVLKRVRQSKKANSKNRHYKSRMKTAIKNVLEITDKSKVDNKLNKAINNKMVLASPFVHFYVFLALEKHNMSDDIIKIIKHKWGYWAENNYPTTWENWNVDFPDGSQCHSFSVHPLYFINKISEHFKFNS